MTPANKTPNDNQWRIIWFALTALAIAVLLALGAGAIWAIGRILDILSPVLWPLAIAAVLAYVLDPAVSWLEHRGLPRAWGILVVFAVAFCIVAGVLASVLPQMMKETKKLVNTIPTYTTWVQEKFTNWANHLEKPVPPQPQSANTNSPPVAPPASHSVSRSNSTNSLASKTNAPPVALSTSADNQIHSKIVASATDWFGKLLTMVGSWLLAELAKATALLDVVVAFILIPIYAFYFLREKKWIKGHWTQYLPIRNSRIKDEAIFIIDSINQYMIAFFRGQILVAICSGVLYTIGFLTLGLDYAFLLGFICLLFAIVPFLGPMISCLFSLILTAMQFADWLHPLMVIAIFVIVLSLENFFYSPRIMGHRVGMHPLVIIVAVMIGITLLGGVLGGVLSIPFAAALRVILSRYLWKKNGPSPAK